MWRNYQRSLKPFQATEIYKKRLESQGATDAEKSNLNPNARNGFVNNSSSNTTNLLFNNGDEAMITAEPQNGYTEVKHEGIDTKAKKTTIASAINGGNIGAI